MLKNILRSTMILAIAACAAFGQLSTTNTTLSTAVAANSNAQWCLASATGVQLPSLSAGLNGSFLSVDREIAQVTAQGSSSTCFQVKRGQLGTSANAAHISGGTVYVGTAAASSGDTSRPFNGVFVVSAPSGFCVRASQYSLPVVVTGVPNGGGMAGSLYDCINQSWTNVSPLGYLLLTGGTQPTAASPSAATAIQTITGGVGGAQSATTGNGAAGGAVSVTGGLGGVGGTSSGTGGAGGALTYTAGAGAGTITGGTGGAITVTAGAGGNGSTAGGSGGALTLGSGAAGTGGTGTSGAVLLKAGTTVLYSTAAAGTGGIASAYSCGATSGTTTCANTATAGGARIVFGIATLSSNSAVISAISPAFTSTSTFTCVANDITTRANPVQVANTSSSSITITNTTGASDVISWQCVGY